MIRQISKTEYSSLSDSLFYSEQWINIFNNTVEFYGIFNTSERLKGGFVLAKENKFGLNFFRPPRLMNNISLLYEFSSKNTSKILSEEKNLMQELAEFFNNLPYHIITIYLPAEYVDMQPFYWLNFKVIPYYTYLIDLADSLLNIEERFSPERRNDIKKAIKDGVICQRENNPDLVKQLTYKTFARKNKSISSELFDKVLFGFADSQNSVTYITYKDEKPLAAVFCVYDRVKMYYLIGGYDDKARHHGAGSLSLYSAIKYAKELGIHYFDFEGSMIPEVEKYFRGFGGKLTPYYSINKAVLPLEFMLKFYRRSVF